MRVILVNGSPKENGCTFTALSIVAEELESNGIETEFLHLGREPIQGCIDCRHCMKEEKCAIEDRVNTFTDAAKEADGFVFGSPVHFAGIGGSMKSFMDRALFSSRTKPFQLKPGAAVVSARRAGTTAALDQLHKYIAYGQMPQVSSRYWNMVHGNTPQQVREDLEGVQIMRVLGRNMAWLLRSIAAGKAAGVEPPPPEPVIFTNFIR
ncbi:MAG: flavodoxin family protein [Oscillospiraceae bacterium]|nr:flavodoxin family protein [Oscillospiraceae bacterium]